MARKARPDLDLWTAACEPAWARLREARGSAETLRVFESLPFREQWLVALAEVYGQVFNGGISQLYCNDKGWLAPAAIEGLRVIGLNEAARVLELGHRTFQPEVEEHEGAITDALHELSDRLSPQFWRETRDLQRRVADHLRAESFGS